MIPWFHKFDAYFIGIFSLIVSGFLYQFHFEQFHSILWINHYHNESLDLFFSLFTQMGEWFPYVILVIYFFFTKDKKTSIGLIITGLSVLLFVSFFKYYFDHPRPGALFRDMGLSTSIHQVKGVDLLMGFNSFPSGHTTSAFAIYGFLALQYPNNKIIHILCLLTAALVGFSRLYLSQHFPEDVLFGIVLGTSLATIVSIFINKYFENFTK